MYQTLIWFGVLSYHACRLRPALDAKDLQRLTDTLIDGMGRDAELRGNLLGTQMLVDEAQAVELTARQARDARGDMVIRRLA